MPYVNVPNDLSKVKTKMALNLTKRQLICFGCAAAVGIPSYLLARGSIGNTGAMFLMVELETSRSFCYHILSPRDKPTEPQSLNLSALSRTNKKIS